MRTPTTNAAGGPVFYAGRFAPEVTAGLPEGCEVLDDWDVLPAGLVGAEGATVLVVLDPLSFPFESLNGTLLDVPLVVVLPENADADFLVAVFGGPMFERLDFFDRVATADAKMWENLRRRYRLARGQLLLLDRAEPAAAAGEIEALLRAEAPGTLFSGNGHPGKVAHRAQSAALGPWFAGAQERKAEDVPLRVLEVGSGAGRWTASFDPGVADYHGLDEDEDAVLAARSEWPEASFSLLGPGLIFPHEDETFDLAFSVGLVGRHPLPATKHMLSEMWRVTKPGGRLLFLENFVTTRETTRSVPYPGLSVLAFAESLLVATDWQVVLEHMESLRYPGEALTRGGIVVVSRLGVPARW